MTPEPIRVRVSAPGLVVLVGAAGSGKSTLAARLFAPADILSSDAFREVVAGDATDQRATRVAFSILHREVRKRLGAGRLVVVDATNVERHARLGLLRIARAAGVPSVAIVLASDGVTTHARNAARAERVVPAAVVDRHLAAVARLGGDAAEIEAVLRLEGFGAVHVLSDGATQVVVETGAPPS
jgi:predicted kinase